MAKDRGLIPPGMKSSRYLKEMPTDHPLYKRGFIIGGRFSKQSSRVTKEPPVIDTMRYGLNFYFGPPDYWNLDLSGEEEMKLYEEFQEAKEKGLPKKKEDWEDSEKYLLNNLFRHSE
ncbi:hypothetical protein ACFL4N_08900, partial [Thermodesulfobacteriota bacterium]